MDLLSRLLALMPVTGVLDQRCHFGAPWRIDHAVSEAQEIPYHILLRGSAIIEDGIGPPLQMAAGDIVLFPSGATHVLHDGSGRRPAKIVARDVSVSGLEIVNNLGKGEAADVLCGRFLMPVIPQHLLRDHLPGTLLVHSVKKTPEQASDALSGDSRLARLIQLMREETLEQGPGSVSLVNHLSGALFGLTLRFANQADAPPRGLLALAQRPRLQPALSAMFDEPGTQWSLPQLAALCHMSRATFARHFEEAIGRSASDLLTEIRMAIAGRRLAQSALPIAAIGEEVGYRSDAAFQRAFKKQVGVTPAQWRGQAKSGAIVAASVGASFSQV